MVTRAKSKKAGTGTKGPCYTVAARQEVGVEALGKQQRAEVTSTAAAKAAEDDAVKAAAAVRGGGSAKPASVERMDSSLQVRFLL